MLKKTYRRRQDEHQTILSPLHHCRIRQPFLRSGCAQPVALGAGASSTETTDIPIAYEELLVSLPAAHPLASQKHIRLEDRQEPPFVLQGPRRSIRILADQLFREAGFQPVIAFESDDVPLVDSMMYQAVGVRLVSKAHVFPCEELVYRPLAPPVRQTLYLPLGSHVGRTLPTVAKGLDQLIRNALADVLEMPRGGGKRR